MDLRTRTLKSMAWFAGTRLWMQALSWGVTIVLARLLTPADYGLFGMAMAVIAFLELFQEFGFGAAIIQRQDLSRQQLNAIFFIALAGSLTIALAAVFGAGLAARFYEEPRLIGIVQLLGLSFLLNSLGMIPYNLLTKEIDFRRRSLAEAAGFIASAVASLALAYYGYGVWALAFGYLARAAVRDVCMAVSCGWLPGIDVSFTGIKDVMRFGLGIAGATLSVTLSNLANTAIIGRVLGGTVLGLYSMADSLGTSPLHRLSTAVINQLSLPVFSKLQDDTEELRTYFLKITRYFALISLPAQIGMALVAPDLVLVVLSAKWQGMVGLLQVFSVGGAVYTVTLPTGPLLLARGRSAVIFHSSTTYAVSIVVGFLVGAQFGLVGVATAWACAYPTLRLAMLWFALREIAVAPSRYLNDIQSALLATAVMTIAVLLTQALAGPQMGSLARLALAVVGGSAAYVASILALDRKLTREVVELAQGVFARPKVARA